MQKLFFCTFMSAYLHVNIPVIFDVLYGITLSLWVSFLTNCTAPARIEPKTLKIEFVAFPSSV